MRPFKDELKITTLPSSGSDTIDVVDGWRVTQRLNARADRWYVSFSVNSPMSRCWARTRMLRSHYVYLRGCSDESVPIGFVIHHADLSRHNDTFANLELMTSADHDELHRSLESFRKPSFLGRKHSDESREVMRAKATLRGNNRVWDSPKREHYASTKALMSESSSGERNPRFRSDLDAEAVNKHYSNSLSLRITAEHFGCSVAAIRSRLREDLYVRSKKSIPRRYNFDDAAMRSHFLSHGARATAQKYGCTEALIYYRLRKYREYLEELQSA